MYLYLVGSYCEWVCTHGGTPFLCSFQRKQIYLNHFVYIANLPSTEASSKPTPVVATQDAKSVLRKLVIQMHRQKYVDDEEGAAFMGLVDAEDERVYRAFDAFAASEGEEVAEFVAQIKAAIRQGKLVVLDEPAIAQEIQQDAEDMALVVDRLFLAGQLTCHERACLKDLLVLNDELVLASFDAIQGNDYDELCDTLQRIVVLKDEQNQWSGYSSAQEELLELAEALRQNLRELDSEEYLVLCDLINAEDADILHAHFLYDTSDTSVDELIAVIFERVQEAGRVFSEQDVENSISSFLVR